MPPVSLAISLVVFIAGTSHAVAGDVAAGSIVVQKPWSIATPPTAKVAGGFMTLVNTGKASDRLVGATSEVSGSVEIHEMTLVNGVMMMRHTNPGITVKPRAKVVLKPFSHHLMLMDLQRPLVAGEKIKVTLEFEKAGKVPVEFPVEAMGAKGPSGAGPSGQVAPKSK